MMARSESHSIGRLSAAAYRARVVMFTLVSLLVGNSLVAAELHSNGLGGGDWSDPTTWREKMIPTGADDAVISRGDVVAFDRNDAEKPSCNQIFIDPKGVLAFKTGLGPITCSVAGQIESYGTIRIDGTKSASDRLELRLVGETPEVCVIKLLKGAALVTSGRRSLEHGQHNVVVNCVIGKPTVPPSAPGKIEAGAATSLQLNRSEINNLTISASNIDNTGAKVGERLVITDNHFSGLAHLFLVSCDSPLIVGNLIELPAGTAYKESAMYINGCPLADIRNNQIRGRYAMGVQGRAQVDSAVTDNEIEGCATGFYWYGTNGMIKRLTVRNCDTGMTATSMSGVFEDCKVEACKTGYYHALATAQLTNVQFTSVPKDGIMVSFYAGPLTLLNCNVPPETIQYTNKALAKAKDGVPCIESLEYMIVKCTGPKAAGAQVEVATANPAKPLPAGALDPNVRNTPARIGSSGLTPLPESLEPLIVKSWWINDDLKVEPAPKYTVRVIAGPPGTPPLANREVTPDATWFRNEPNSKQPTLELMTP